MLYLSEANGQMAVGRMEVIRHHPLQNAAAPAPLNNAEHSRGA